MGKRVWQSSALVSPTKALNRDVAPIGDDIEPVGESRADVEMCGGVEDVVSVLTLVRRAVAQVFHVLRLEELREQLEEEKEEEGGEDRLEESEEVESGKGRVKERQPPHTWMK